MSETKLLKVPLSKIYPTTDNCRRLDAESESFQALIASIRESGQKVPGIARPDPLNPDAYDLRGGRRRYEALKIIGQETMDLLVRDMTDEEALLETVLENFREDLSPIEEAGQVDLLIQNGYTFQEVGDRLGKSVQWVARRASILSLSCDITDRLAAGCGIELTVGAMEILSRYDTSVQVKVFDDLINDHADWNWEQTRSACKISEKMMADVCSTYHTDLQYVAWDLNDDELHPTAGACSVCPKRSGCQPLLFTADEVGEKEADLCLDADCFRQKKVAYFKRVADEVSEKAGKPVVLLNSHRDERDELLKQKINTAAVHEYEKAKKSDPESVPVIDMNELGEPKVKYMKPRDYAPAVKAKGEQKTLSQKREELTKKRELYTVGLLHEAFSSALLVDMVIHENALSAGEQLLNLALSFGICLSSWIYDTDALEDDEDTWINSDDHFEASDWLNNQERVLSAGWTAVRKSIAATIARRGSPWQIHTVEYIDHARRVAGLIGWDWDAGMAKAVEMIPEPKAWEKEAAA